MATLTDRTVIVHDSLGRRCTVDFLVDSVLFTLLTIVVNNETGAAYVFTVTNTANVSQTFTQTVNSGQLLSITPVITVTMNPDRSMPNNWIYQG